MGIFQKLFKKEPPTIVVKQEIDYEKLADAIVKAQMKLKEEEEKQEKKPSAAYTLFQLTAATFLFVFGIAILIFCSIISYIMGIGDFDVETKIGIFLLALVLGMISMLALAGAFEVYTSNKRDFINNVFTAIMAFSTLIITIISAVIAYRAL